MYIPAIPSGEHIFSMVQQIRWLYARVYRVHITGYTDCQRQVNAAFDSYANRWEKEKRKMEMRKREWERERQIRRQKGNFGRMCICINAPRKVYTGEFRWENLHNFRTERGTRFQAQTSSTHHVYLYIYTQLF